MQSLVTDYSKRLNAISNNRLDFVGKLGVYKPQFAHLRCSKFAAPNREGQATGEIVGSEGQNMHS